MPTENMLTDIKTRSKARSRFHDILSWRQSIADTAIRVTHIIIASVTTVLGAVNVHGTDQCGVPTWAVGLNATVASVGTVGAFLDLASKAERHVQLASLWSDIATDIEFELAKPFDMRPHAAVFMAHIQERYTAVQNQE